MFRRAQGGTQGQDGRPHDPWALRLAGIRLPEQTDRLRHRETPLFAHLIAIGGEDLAAQQATLDAVTEVDGEHLGMPGLMLGQLVDSHLGGDGAPHQVVEVGMAAQGLLHQGALDLAAVVAAHRGDEPDGAATDGILKTGLDEGGAATGVGPREEGDRDGLAARRVALCQPVADAPAHLLPGHADLGDGEAWGEIVDQTEYRQGALPDGLRQPLIADRAEQYGVTPLVGALAQLLALLGQGAVAPRLVDPHPGAQSPGLFHHALIDRQPVGIPQMGIEGAQGQGPG
ncbi:hypothetical protein D3C79_671110 [compost metagenome]